MTSYCEYEGLTLLGRVIALSLTKQDRAFWFYCFLLFLFVSSRGQAGLRAGGSRGQAGLGVRRICGELFY